MHYQIDSHNAEVVRLPTAEDILRTQELIRIRAAELEVVNAEYKEAKRKFEAAQAKRNAMERELLERRAYLARVRALPQEVLGLVFLFYTDDLAQSPWILMQVTRTWRATALSTRAIWAKIMITSPAWKKSGGSRRKEGREVCGSKEQLDRAFQRAGSATLDIMFALINPYGARWAREYDRKAIGEMLRFLSSSRKCLQVHRLEIKGPCASTMYSNTWRTPAQFPALLEFPKLRAVYIKSPLRSDFTEKLLSASKEITEAEFLVSSEYPFGMESVLQCRSMVTLTLDARKVYGWFSFETDKERLRSALDNTSYLTTLHINGFSCNAVTVLRLPALHTLVLTGSEIWPLNASNLTNITLSANSFIGAGPAGSNHFPLLTSLTINASTLLASPLDYLENWYFPPLHTLDLCLGKLKQDLEVLLTHRANLNPVIFRLRKAAMSTASLTGVIQSMERLEELQLEDVPLKKEFFDFLASRKANPDASDSNEIGMHCPLLVRLQVDLKAASPAQKKAIKPAAKKAIQIRVKAGMAMEKCSIRVSEDDGWVDLLA